MISIVIPVYNEAGLVREAAAELCRKLDELGWDYEILFAENGSRDDTNPSEIPLLAHERIQLDIGGDVPPYIFDFPPGD